jgi:hypothetical protein
MGMRSSRPLHPPLGSGNEKRVGHGKPSWRQRAGLSSSRLYDFNDLGPIYLAYTFYAILSQGERGKTKSQFKNPKIQTNQQIIWDLFSSGKLLAFPV